MQRIQLSTAAVLAIAFACSGDSDGPQSSSTDSAVNDNQPGAGDVSGDPNAAGDEGANGEETTSEPEPGDDESPEAMGSDEGQADQDVGLDPGDGSETGGGDDDDPGMGGEETTGEDADGEDADDPGTDGEDTGSEDTGSEDTGDSEDDSTEEDTRMSFFVTSRGSGSGGDFGGIEGADALCTLLAAESPLDVGDRTWRAYLSTSTENARDRIGAGPWRNFEGVVIANDVEQLHDQGQNGSLNATWPLGDAGVALDEQGEQVPNQPVTHDIVTGSTLDGTVAPSGTCDDWTSQTGSTQNGHSNRAGGGQNPQAWSSSHATGCGEPTQNFQQGTVSQGGGRGSIYCFAID